MTTRLAPLVLTSLVLALSLLQSADGTLNVASTRPAELTGSLKSHLLIGYWENWKGSSGFIRLKDVPKEYDVIDVAFGVPAAGSTSTITFSVDPSESEPDFIRDLRALRTRDKVVLLSIGGENAVVKLNTGADVGDFVRSLSALIKRFGFNGIDIDFENTSLVLDSGDVDFKHPTTPAVVNLISALKQLKDKFGPGFVISLAPETLSVQGGFNKYEGRAGAYLPVIYGVKDVLSYVHVQDYNSGTMYGLDGAIYTQGTADFHVAMTEMLLQGFPVAGDRRNMFPALNPEQVAFGVPASAAATGSGFTSYSDAQKALNYLVRGVSFGGNYKLRNQAGYPGLRGAMTFSINQDVAAGQGLSKSFRQFLDGLGR